MLVGWWSGSGSTTTHGKPLSVSPPLSVRDRADGAASLWLTHVAGRRRRVRASPDYHQRAVSYAPIVDLSDDLRRRESTLASLVGAWKERREELRGRDELRVLHERMRRRWAIDTGMIEGLYSITRGTTELLIDRGLHADLISHGESDLPANELVAYLHDHAEVYDWLFDFVAQERPFGTSWIKELHQLLTRHQDSTTAIDGLDRMVEVPLDRGAWKRLPNNPRRPDGSVHEYAPPELVSGEMDRLVEWHLEHADGGVSPEVEAAWLHHRFTQIHPFQDGNGRVARALATLVLIRAERFPMSVPPDRKSEYIDALERADAGDLDPLIEFIAGQQTREFGRALAVAEQISDEHQLFAAAFAKASQARGQRAAQYEDVKRLARDVIDAAQTELRRRQREFGERARAAGVGDVHHVHVFRPDEEKRHFYRGQIEAVAGDLGYAPNFQEYKDWVRVSIVNDHDDRAHVLVLSAHGFGRSFKGVISVIGLIEKIDRDEEDATRSRPVSATEEPFTFGYLDLRDHVLPRFRDWLHGAWLCVLKNWEEGL